jgi:hypothetical protein
MVFLDGSARFRGPDAGPQTCSAPRPRAVLASKDDAARAKSIPVLDRPAEILNFARDRLPRNQLAVASAVDRAEVRPNVFADLGAHQNSQPSSSFQLFTVAVGIPG